MEGFDEGVNISSTVEAVMVVVWVVEDGISVLCLQFFWDSLSLPLLSRYGRYLQTGMLAKVKPLFLTGLDRVPAIPDPKEPKIAEN